MPADLLALLSRRETVVLELLHLNALGRIVGQLQTGDVNLTQSLLRVVCYMATDMVALQEMYQAGAWDGQGSRQRVAVWGGAVIVLALQDVYQAGMLLTCCPWLRDPP